MVAGLAAAGEDEVARDLVAAAEAVVRVYAGALEGGVWAGQLVGHSWQL